MAELLTIWGQNELLPGSPPTRPYTIPNVPGCSVKLTNNSAFYLDVIQNGTGIMVDSLPPYSYLIFPNTPDLAVQVNQKKPASSLTPDMQEVTFATMSGTVQYQHGSTQFNGTQNTLTPRLKMDTASGSLAATSSAQYVEFTKESAFVEFWNLDTQGRKLWINFNQEATGGGPGDIVLLPDPNGGGQGAYWECAADYNGFWYIGGAGQFAAWYNSANG